MKDYYAILDLSPGAGPEEIKRAYRQKALRHHPDRNPGDAAATERFKEVAEAYAVLMDPGKRQEYDRCRAQARGGGQASRDGFAYSQEDIFRDMFRSAPGGNFEELFREFERSGLRFDRQFFHQTLFGGRGFFIGGIFVFGLFGSPLLRTLVGRLGSLLAGNLMRQLLSFGVGRMLGRGLGGLGPTEESLVKEAALQARGGLDITYTLLLQREQAAAGTAVTIALPQKAGAEKVRVRIPAGTKDGQLLRLAGKGREQEGERGDLYITVHLGQ